jgi:hypothetical protein
MAKIESTKVEVKEHGVDGQQGKLAGKYSKLETNRSSHLFRAQECSKLTIPTLMPLDGHSNSTKFNTPYQGIGARGVNNLASKLLLALLPPNHPFFKLEVPESVLAEFGENKGDVELRLSSIERDVMSDVNSSNARLAYFEALKQLVVAGNVLINLPEKSNQVRIFRLDRYVVQRDIMGNVLCIMVKEEVAPEMLSEDIRKQCDLEEGSDKQRTVPVYTHIEWDEEQGLYEVEQEVNGFFVPDSYGTYPKDKLPWLPLRLVSVDNEDYGRSYVEEYLGDLKSLEGLTKAIVEGSAASAKLLWLVNPNGTTKIKQIAEANNNAILQGNAADVTVLHADKYADFRVALETIKEITDRLGAAFMLNSSVQRSGERVTAEEIRYMARELEDALGGIYTVLTQELQLPFLRVVMERLRKAKTIPTLPKDLVKPTIITGLEAIGRSQDLDKLQMFVQSLTQLNYQDRLNAGEVINRIANALSIDTQGLIKTEEEIQAAMQQAQQAQMMQQAIGPGINQMGNIATKAMELNAPTDPQLAPQG